MKVPILKINRFDFGEMIMKNNDLKNKEELIVVETVENTENIAEERDVRIPVKHPDNPGVSSFLKALYDPTELSQKTGKIQWFFFPLLPAFCFALFASQLFFENVGTGVRAGNFLIVPIGALCGYALTLIGCLLMFVILKIMRRKFSFKDSVAVLSGCFVGPVLLEILGTVVNIVSPFPTSVNIGAFGLFAFMIPLSYFTAKNSKGKIFPMVWLTIIAVLNVVIICLMIKVGGVA